MRYIADFIGKELTGEPFKLTNNRAELQIGAEPLINYSEEEIAGSFQIKPHLLLFEKTINQEPVPCFLTEGLICFFKTEGDHPFDIFAASFYLLSRYEEYLPHKKDEYGRYAYENSLAWREDFLYIPLVNRWIKHFGVSLKKRFPTFTIHYSAFNFLPTYDIDEAYSYKHKQWWRSGGGAARDLLKVDRSRVLSRAKVLLGKRKDPFDSYDFLDRLHEAHQLMPRYFFLLAAKTGKYDKNIKPDEFALHELIRRHAKKYKIGIHPSWQAGDAPELLNSEIKTLEQITGKKIDSSRQHFIRFELPTTYRRLLDAGIREDFSMGYGSVNGFRASVASTFYWYDLEKDQATDLLLYPFCFMEANSFFEQKRSSHQALDELNRYYKVVKEVNGTLITIWHNTFLGTDKMFDGWRDAYERFIENFESGIGKLGN